MGISTKILTTSGFRKIPMFLIDNSRSKIRVYSLQDQTPEMVKKVKEALHQEFQKGRVFQGDLSQMDQDILTKPYLFKDEKHLTFISYETVIFLRGAVDVSKFVQSEIFQKKEMQLALENRDLEQISNLPQNSLSRIFLQWISVLRGGLIPESLLRELFNHIYPERDHEDFINALNHLTQCLLLQHIPSSSISNYYHASSLMKAIVLSQLPIQEQNELCLLIKGKVANQLKNLINCKDCTQEYTSYRDQYINLLRMQSLQSTPPSLQDFYNFFNVGNLFYTDKLYSEALLCFTEAWGLLQQIEKVDLNHKHQILNRLGMTHVKLTKFTKALGYYEHALMIAQQLKNEKEQLKLHKILRDLYISLKEHQQAIKHCEQALELTQKLGDISEQRDIYNNFGKLYDLSMDFYKKIEFYKNELEFVIKHGDLSAQEKMYIHLGDAYDSLGYHEDALTYYQRYLEMIEKSDSRVAKRRAYSNLGAVYNSLGHRLKAVDYHEKALKIAQDLEDHKEEARIYGNLGHTYRSSGEITKAMQSYETALKIAQDENNDEEVERAYSNLGNMCRSLKQYQKALDHHHKALEIARRANNMRKIGKIYSHLGNVCRSLRQYSEAFSYHDQALKIAQSHHDEIEEGRIYRLLGGAYNSLGDFDNAIQNYTIALEIAIKCNHLSEEESVYSHLGAIYNSLGDYKQALEHHNKALELAINLKNRVVEGRAYINLGIVYHSLGDIREAIKYYKKCLAIVLELNDLAEEGRTYCNLGNAYDSLGDYHEAIKYHEKDLKIGLQLNDLIVEGRAYGNLGVVYASLKEFQKAIDYQEKALKFALGFKDHKDEGKIYSNLGNIYSSLEDYNKAIDYQKKALKIALEFKDRKDEGKFLGNLGNVYGASGSYKEAITYYTESLKIAQELNDRIGEGVTYGNLGNIYAALGDYHLAEECLRKSIQAAAIQQEKVKHFEWQITLFEEQSKQYLSLELLLLMQNKFEEALEVSDARRARALASLISQKISLGSDKPSSLERLTVQRMQALAKKLQTTFVMYSLVDITQLIQVWMIPSTGLAPIAVTLPSARDEFKNLQEVFKTFPYEGIIKRPNKGEKSSTRLFQEKLATWYRLFIEPLSSYLPSCSSQETLTIIPDGILAHLPFGAFYNASEDRYLIEKHPISIAPSIQVLSLLDQLPHSSSHHALLIGKNRENYSDPLEEKEVQGIASLFKQYQREVSHEKATPAYLLEQAPRMQWIHLACYGANQMKSSQLNDSHSIFEGAFQLDPDDHHPSGEIHSKEIVSMSLKADLVFMTASQLGRGNLQQEGSIGPVWSFLGAGALSTIASYWALPAGDMTVNMVETFYKHYLGIDTPLLNSAKALQKAVLMVMKTHRNQPRQWGGFFLSGLVKPPKIETLP